MTNHWHSLLKRAGCHVDLSECQWTATVECAAALSIRDIWGSSTSSLTQAQQQAKRRKRIEDFQSYPEIQLSYTSRDTGLKVLGHMQTFNNSGAERWGLPGWGLLEAWAALLICCSICHSLVHMRIHMHRPDPYPRGYGRGRCIPARVWVSNIILTTAGGDQQHQSLLYALLTSTNQREPVNNENQIKHRKGNSSFSEEAARRPGV